MENFSRHSVLLQFPGGCKCMSVGSCGGVLTGKQLRESVTEETSLCCDFYLTRNGSIVLDRDEFSYSVVGLVHVVPRLRGGKGGFGSMLRALGSGIERTTNREACRDLSGRRMRDVNADKKLADWVKQEAERERQREEARKERRERRRAEPKHNFDSHGYLTSVKEQSERTEDAVRAGMCAAVSSPKAATSAAPSSCASASEAAASSSCSRAEAASAGDGTKESSVASSSDRTSRKRPAAPLEKESKKKKKKKGGLDDFLGVDMDSSSSSEDESESSGKSADSAQ